MGMDLALQDRRRLRTRQALQAALVGLVEERGFATLTIQDIADQADVARATFYLNYPDKNSLLFDTLKTLHIIMLRQVEDLTLDEINRRALILRITFEHVEAYHGFYRALLEEHQTRGMVLDYVRRYIVFATLKMWMPHLPFLDRLVAEMFANSTTGSLLGLIAWWLENERPYPPAEMAHRIRQMLGRPAQRLIPDIDQRYFEIFDKRLQMDIALQALIDYPLA